MTSTDKTETALIALLIDRAPDLAAVIKLRAFQAALRNESPDVRARMLAGALYDGLAYGNWPWTPRP